VKFLTAAKLPNLTFTRTKRKCIINEAKDLIALYESTVKIEINLPSIWQGLKDKIEQVATNHLVNIFSSNLAMGAT
jgi:hypothetical protein